MQILCVCLSATIQRTLFFDSFSIDSVNRTYEWREDAIGKALNAARVLNQLEAGCSLALCPVGNDNVDRFMNLVSHDHDLYVHPIITNGTIRECWTLLGGKHATTTEVICDDAQDFRHLAGAEAEVELLETVREYMQLFDALLFAGSRPTQWSSNLCARICKLAIDAGKVVLADFCGNELLDTLKICTPQIIKINEDEFCRTFGGKHQTEEELAKTICKKSAELHNIVVVTRGKNKTLAAQDGKAFVCPSKRIKVLNTTACGDSFSAGFLHEYLLEHDLEKSLKAGARCAALNAQTIIPGAIK